MPELRADPLLRWARGLLTAAVALSVGGVAHVAAGGLMPSLPELAVLLLLASLVGGAFLGRPATRARLVALVVAGQATSHLVFAALAGHSGAPTGAAGPATGTRPATLAEVGGQRRGSLYDLTTGSGGPADGAAPGVPGWVVHLVADLTGPQAWMTLAHALAAAALGWWLASGERALWSLVCLAGCGVHAAAVAVRRRARLALAATLAVAAAASRPATLRAVRTRAPDPWRPAMLRPFGSTLVRRGPPVAA